MILLVCFLSVAALLWLSVFGYLLLLGCITLRRRQISPAVNTHPAIAVVIPTLNEERLILSKLDDIERTDYPRNRIQVVVVDGGSCDRTTTLVQQKIDSGEAIQLICVESAHGKPSQIWRVLSSLTQDIIVFTDVDSVLDPACIRELVSVLMCDPHTGVVGASVRPSSALLEERIHWWFLNYLWWLEGEALSSGMISGVCYALRRETVTSLAQTGQSVAEDAHLTLAVRARGFRVRTCRTARATEIRVPQTVREFLRFRYRRGAAYVSALLRFPLPSHAPVACHLVHRIRLWHFLVMPKVAVGLILSGCILLFTPHWPWTVFTILAFGMPVLAALSFSKTLSSHRYRTWTLVLAAGRLAALTLASLLALNFRIPPHFMTGVR